MAIRNGSLSHIKRKVLSLSLATVFARLKRMLHARRAGRLCNQRNPFILRSDAGSAVQWPRGGRTDADFDSTAFRRVFFSPLCTPHASISRVYTRTRIYVYPYIDRYIDRARALWREQSFDYLSRDSRTRARLYLIGDAWHTTTGVYIVAAAPRPRSQCLNMPAAREWIRSVVPCGLAALYVYVCADKIRNGGFSTPQSSGGLFTAPKTPGDSARSVCIRCCCCCWLIAGYGFLVIKMSL